MKSILDVSLRTNQSGAMKKILFILLSAALLGACKKNGSSTPKDVFLSKIYVNGEPETEYVYNSEGKLIEEKYYDNDAVAGRYEYHYDHNGNLLEKLNYTMPENKLAGRHIMTLNAEGKIARNAIWNTSGEDSGTLGFYIDHDYTNGLCTKQTWRTEDEEEVSYRNQFYYPNGNLRTSESYWVFGGVAEKQWGSSYGPSDTTLPASMTDNTVYPINFYFPYLLSSYIDHFQYDEGDVKEHRKEIISERKYNSRGLVTGETITTKYFKPLKLDEVRTLKFEYVER